MREAAILHRAHPINRGCVFAWDARCPIIELTTGRLGVMTTNVTSQLSQAGAIARQFAGGGFGNSQIDFGLFPATSSMHFQPATWLTYMHFANISPGSQARMVACQSDNNAVAGWQLGPDDVNADRLGLTLVKSVADVRASTNVTLTPTGWHCVGVTSDGINGNGIQIWIDGEKVVTDVHTLGSGGSVPVTADPFLIGQHRFQSATSSNEASANLRCFDRILPDYWMREAGKKPYLGFNPEAANLAR
jgi:hypothetical protein